MGRFDKFNTSVTNAPTSASNEPKVATVPTPDKTAEPTPTPKAVAPEPQPAPKAETPSPLSKTAKAVLRLKEAVNGGIIIGTRQKDADGHDVTVFSAEAGDGLRSVTGYLKHLNATWDWSDAAHPTATLPTAVLVNESAAEMAHEARAAKIAAYKEKKAAKEVKTATASASSKTAKTSGDTSAQYTVEQVRKMLLMANATLSEALIETILKSA